MAGTTQKRELNLKLDSLSRSRRIWITVAAFLLAAFLVQYVSFFAALWRDLGSTLWEKRSGEGYFIDDHFWEIIRAQIPTFIFGTIVVGALLTLVALKLNEITWALGKVRFRYFAPVWSKKGVGILTGVTLLFWLPYIVVLAPGTAPYDPLWQLVQTRGTGSLAMSGGADGLGTISNHKPVLHSWTLGAFVKLGDLLGNQSLGLMVFMVLQVALTAFVLSLSCSYLERLGTPQIVRFSAFLFSALLPFIPIYAMSAFNDAMFSWIYVLWFLLIIETIRSRGASLRSYWFLALMAASGVLLMLTKSPGKYIVAVTFIVMVIVMAGRRPAMLGVTVVTILVGAVLVPKAVYPSLGVVESSQNEAMGPFWQATGAVVYFAPETLTASDKEAIDGVLDYDKIQPTFLIEAQDGIKNAERMGASSSATATYLQNWVDLGLRHPKLYLFATLFTNAPFFFPYAEFDYYDNRGEADMSGYLDAIVAAHPQVRPVADDLTIGRVPQFDHAKAVLVDSLNHLRNVPIFGSVAGLGLWATWVPLIMMFLIATRRPRYWLLLIPFLVSFAVLFVSPLFMARYALPMVYTIPLMMGTAFSSSAGTPEELSERDEKKKKAIAS